MLLNYKLVLSGSGRPGFAWGILIFAKLLFVSFLAWPVPVFGQSMSPLVQRVFSAQDYFTIRVTPVNTFSNRLSMRIRVYDADFRLINALVTPREFSLASRGRRVVAVSVPFEGKKIRRIKICAEATPRPSKKTQIRTRICGRYTARRL